MVSGFVVAWYCYLVNPKLPAAIHGKLSFINRVLDNKYYADWFNEQIVARGARCLGHGFWKAGDGGLIDGLLVNGSARLVGWVAAVQIGRAACRESGWQVVSIWVDGGPLEKK